MMTKALEVAEVYDHRTGWHWIAQGDGPMRPIAVEGKTRKEARTAWMSQFANQYAEMETASHYGVEHTYDDIRTNNYER